MLTRHLLPLLALAFCVSVTTAQEAKDKGENLSRPQELTLPTADGVKLAATFYPSPKEEKKKEAVPIVLLHMWKRSGNDFAGLAARLQKLGHAVLVPDLRGHGDSTNKRGVSAPLKAATMSQREYLAMVQYDLPALKQFLVRKNNAGELNIEKLCLIGAEMGASVALGYTYVDWTVAPQGRKKQGQDVKGLVLISPEWSTRGLSIARILAGQPLSTTVQDPQLRAALRNPESAGLDDLVTLDFRKEVDIYIVCGNENRKADNDARRLYRAIKPRRAAPGSDNNVILGKALKTTLQGTHMLGVSGLNLEDRIAYFIQIRLVKRSLPWALRENPYE